MKASKILIEADESKHIRHSYTDGVEESERKYCAIGYLACKQGLVGIVDTYPRKTIEYKWSGGPDEVLRHYIRKLPIVECPVNCPEIMPGGVDIAGMIVHLNDTHGWTFKQIGEWLSQYEK